MTEISKAIIKVMSEVEGIEKSMDIGTGYNSYKGVSDKSVRLKIGLAMRNNGLSILPIGITSKTSVDRWEATDKCGTKQKQSIFTEVETKYLLLHTSGESIEVAGYGHGVDSQDKGAGKATTYALKNALLAMFLVPTGTIEDTDNAHSDDIPVPQLPMITLVQKSEIDKLVTSRGRTVSEVCKIGKINSIDELTKVRAVKLIKHLKSLPEATLH